MYLKGSISERTRERKMHLSSICWLTTQMAATAGDGLYPGLRCEWQGPKKSVRLVLLSQAISRKLEQKWSR